MVANQRPAQPAARGLCPWTNSREGERPRDAAGISAPRRRPWEDVAVDERRERGARPPPRTTPLDGRGDLRHAWTATLVCLHGRAAGRESSHGVAVRISTPHRQLLGDVTKDERLGDEKILVNGGVGVCRRERELTTPMGVAATSPWLVRRGGGGGVPLALLRRDGDGNERGGISPLAVLRRGDGGKERK